MNYNDLKYMIIPTSEKDSVDFECVQQNENDLRYSMDGLFFIVKYTGNKPRCLYGRETYTHQQMLDTVNDPTGIWYQET